MKQKRAIVTMVLAAVFSIGFFGNFSTTQDAAAKRTVKVVKVKKVASKPYRATKGYMYNSAKLTKKIHNLKNYKKTTFYSKKRVTVKTSKNKKAYYMYVANKSNKIKGYVYSKYLKPYQPGKTTVVKTPSTSGSGSSTNTPTKPTEPTVISKSDLESLIAASPDLDPTGQLLSLTSEDYQTYASVFDKNFNVGDYAHKGVFNNDQASIYVESQQLVPYVQKAIDKWNSALGTTAFTLGTRENHSMVLGFGDGQIAGWDGVFYGSGIAVDYTSFHDHTYPYGRLPVSNEPITITLTSDDDSTGVGDGVAAHAASGYHYDADVHYVTTTITGVPADLLETYWVGVITHELGHSLGLDHTPYFQDIMAAQSGTENGQSQENMKYDWTDYKDANGTQGGTMTAKLTQRDIDRAKLTKLLGYW
ncbi:M57 family metalloprotease [Lentilactobacillus kefiri]|uniref:M57 family metalloprotease n=1 Tax=Lentilactobacillus kefiri TaxID=33962 RepID=UPI00345E1FC6